MPISFVTGETGGGKGVYAVKKIKEYLDKGRRVATNLDLSIEYITLKSNNNAPIRLPDKPSAYHMTMLGFGSAPENKNKHEYGLLVLDEISLFLDTKLNKDFAALMAWFVQRRKFHWDIIFIAQNKDQVQDTFYKSLCNYLVICKAKDLLPVPYIGSWLKMAGFSGMLSEAHVAFVHGGKSENDNIIEADEYKNHPYRKMYNTDQFFSDGIEYLVINGETSAYDMRATFTVLPHSVISQQKYIDFHTNEVVRHKKIRDGELIEEGKEMAKGNMSGGIALKMKAGFFILVAVIFVWFNNPMDSALFGSEDSKSDSLITKIDSPLASDLLPFSQLSEQDTVESPDIFSLDYCFENHDPKLVSYVQGNNVLLGSIVFFRYAQNEGLTIKTKVREFTFLDIFLGGYTLDKSKIGILVSKDGQNYYVS